MSRKKKYIEKLSGEQRSSLEKAYKTSDCQLSRRRAQCILLSSGGKSVQELSDIYAVRTRTIYTWFNLWEANGIKGIARKPGQGRKPLLDKDNAEHVKTVKDLIENDAKSSRRVKIKVESELGIKLSKKTLKRFLKNLSTDGNATENG
ncbi:MAG: helix-turn-helix domain-containing protein [Bacteroidetes bacterium]|nr:helix-turn-helix domain-containing protein [Bacteroidota bacterium]